MSRPKPQRPAARYSVSVERDGQTYEGWYSVQGRPPIVYVSSGYGSKATELGNAPPDVVARMLLTELIGHVRCLPRAVTLRWPAAVHGLLEPAEAAAASLDLMCGRRPEERRHKMGGMNDMIEAPTIAELKKKTLDWADRAREQGMEVHHGWHRDSVEQTDKGFRIFVHAHS